MVWPFLPGSVWPARRWQTTFRRLFEQWPDRVRLCPVLGGGRKKLLKLVREFGLEGVVSKRRDSVYKPGDRPGTWVKHKVQQSDDFLVGGFMRGAGGLEELLVGERDDRGLRFVESVKDGFVPHTKRQVLDRLH